MARQILFTQIFFDMKKMIVIACFTMMPFAMMYSSMAAGATSVKEIQGITIDMEGVLLIATSDNPNDPLTLLRVFSKSRGIVAQTDCSGTQCTLNLSNVPPGLYFVRAWTLTTYKQQLITVN